jgi:hypothetical protein
MRQSNKGRHSGNRLVFQTNTLLRIANMKSIMMIVAAAGLALSGSVFAQSNTATSATNASAQSSQVAQTADAQSGQWVPPYGQPVHQKTRAEVYQELVHAEQDGRLAYLNSTIYAH